MKSTAAKKIDILIKINYTAEMQVTPPTLSEIQSISDQVVSFFPKAKTILFGSYARGNPRPDSDVDLLVVTPFSKNAAKVALELCDAIKPRFAVDFIVRTPEEISKRLANRDSFICEILREGVVLHEA